MSARIETDRKFACSIPLDRNPLLPQFEVLTDAQTTTANLERRRVVTLVIELQKRFQAQFDSKRPEQTLVTRFAGPQRSVIHLNFTRRPETGFYEGHLVVKNPQALGLPSNRVFVSTRDSMDSHSPTLDRLEPDSQLQTGFSPLEWTLSAASDSAIYASVKRVGENDHITTFCSDFDAPTVAHYELPGNKRVRFSMSHVKTIADPILGFPALPSLQPAKAGAPAPSEFICWSDGERDLLFETSRVYRSVKGITLITLNFEALAKADATMANLLKRAILSFAAYEMYGPDLKKGLKDADIAALAAQNELILYSSDGSNFFVQQNISSTGPSLDERTLTFGHAGSQFDQTEYRVVVNRDSAAIMWDDESLVTMVRQDNAVSLRNFFLNLETGLISDRGTALLYAKRGIITQLFRKCPWQEASDEYAFDHVAFASRFHFGVNSRVRQTLFFNRMPYYGKAFIDAEGKGITELTEVDQKRSRDKGYKVGKINYNYGFPTESASRKSEERPALDVTRVDFPPVEKDIIVTYSAEETEVGTPPFQSQVWYSAVDKVDPARRRKEGEGEGKADAAAAAAAEPQVEGAVTAAAAADQKSAAAGLPEHGLSLYAAGFEPFLGTIPGVVNAAPIIFQKLISVIGLINCVQIVRDYEDLRDYTVFLGRVKRVMQPEYAHLFVNEEEGSTAVVKAAAAPAK